MSGKEYQNEHYLKNKDKIKDKGKEYRLKNKDKIKEYHLKEKYNLTLEEYNKLITNRCQICNSKERPHVDHDHATGKVRGILCSTCNTGLGLFHEDIELLKNAIKYLSEGEKR